MVRNFCLLAAMAIILGAGIVHGLWTDRWQVSDEPQASAAKLERVVMNFGDWEGRSLEIDERSLAVGNIAGYLHRVYANRRTQVQLSVMVVCGRPGPISQHTPDVCFGGAGYGLVGNASRESLSMSALATPMEFLIGNFHREDINGTDNLRVVWTWSPDGAWSAPNGPRWAFGRYPSLYKLYVVRQLPLEAEPAADDPSVEFLKVFMPQLQKALFNSPLEEESHAVLGACPSELYTARGLDRHLSPKRQRGLHLAGASG